MGVIHCTRLDMDIWLDAACLAALRVQANNKWRKPEQDRGLPANLRNDIQGAIGELVALRYLLAHPRTARLHYTAYVRDGVRKGGAFSRVRTDGTRQSLETKTLTIDPMRSRFLVNEAARMRDERDGIDAYLPVAFTFGRGNALVGRAIKPATVALWPVVKLGQFGAPAHAMDLAEAAQLIWGEPIERFREVLSDPPEECEARATRWTRPADP